MPSSSAEIRKISGMDEHRNGTIGFVFPAFGTLRHPQLTPTMIAAAQVNHPSSDVQPSVSNHLRSEAAKQAEVFQVSMVPNAGSALLVSPEPRIHPDRLFRYNRFDIRLFLNE